MKRYATVLLWFCFLCSTAQPDSRRIMSGSMWKDLNGDPINAHGGGILYFDHVYYWFGEIKKGKTTRAPDISSWEDYRVDAGGISCYSSKDLLNWTCEGLALAPEKKDSASDLHISRVIERP